jgi:PAS domain S-box-containing protein
MESWDFLGHDGMPMATTSARTHAPFLPALLAVTALGVSVVYVLARDELAASEGLGTAVVAGATLLSALAIFSRLRYPGAWRSTGWLGLAVLGSFVVAGMFLVRDITRSATEPGAFDALFLLVLLLYLIPVGIEFGEHLGREERREIVADVALLSVALTVIMYLILRPIEAGRPEAIAALVASFVVAATLAAYGSLALWFPTTAHIGLFSAMLILAPGILRFADQWVDGLYQPGQATIDLPLALSPLLLAMLVNVEPRHADRDPSAPTRYGRVVLTTLSVASACTALAIVAGAETADRIEAEHAITLIVLLAGAIAMRILVNQVRGSNAARAAQDALDQKEVALRETDKVLSRLQRANETLRESEERLRTVFEAAVDGIVELDDEDMIIRTNEAFCRMIDLPQNLVEGQRWSGLAASLATDESFDSLPQTGQGTLRREGNAVYLESRTSEIPGDPPRRLLLVRDVTASRVADQTIRSLFKFLQDRDEDRTRIMRRTNAAIESERNRIARDLHDGPVQGVSAASLSLEAVLLMLKAGDLDEGIEVLSKVRKELSEEADNLRRLMSGLRPPLLEERGLIPALRETLDKYGIENGIETEFVDRGAIPIPQDLETLAYRIVQEALSNSHKHSGATRVRVTVEAVSGQLRLEVSDDGAGFDSAKAREYLQMGRVGLASMRERVELTNGTFMVHSTPGKGTTVMASLPLEALPAAREFAVNEA